MKKTKINNNWMIHKKERALEKELNQNLQNTQEITPSNIINLNSYLIKCNLYTLNKTQNKTENNLLQYK